jgi:uncharacterized repeat protein (TIGR01451 family)
MFPPIVKSARAILISGSILLAAAPAFALPPVLNEVVIDHLGADNMEFVEVWGAVSTSYATYTVLVIDSNGNPGLVVRALTVGTTNGSGLWTTASLGAEAIDNDSKTILLVQNFSGSAGADLDANNDGTFDTAPWSLIKDSVAVSDGAGGDVFYSPVVLQPNFDGLAGMAGGFSRIPQGVDTDSVADWARNDFDGAGLLSSSAATLTTGEAWNTAGWTNRRREEDYWNGVTGATGAALRAAIHSRMGDHQRHDYTSGQTDTWDILEAADENPSNSSQIISLYPNIAYTKFGGGTGPYNREHSWPQSYGFPDEGVTNSPRTDCHHLFLDQVQSNADRGNKPFGTCNAGCTQIATVSNNGHGGVGGGYPGDSNWYMGSDGPTGTFEVWSHRKGDVARAQLYLDVRYEGGNHDATGFAEPDLILTDNTGQIATTGSNTTGTAYMGRLAVLLQWHQADPPDAEEQNRNDVVWRYQGNRNPFVDHPEWVQCVFGNTGCPAASGTADLSISVSDGVTSAVPGGAAIVYTIQVSNAGPDAVTGATVADDFPSSLTCNTTCAASAGSSCSGGAGDLNTSANLLSGGTATYTATCQINAGATGNLVNTATVTAPVGTTDASGNNSATDTDTLTPQADLQIAKTDNVTEATPGGMLTYKIIVSNPGPSNAPGSTVTDNPPAACTSFNWTCIGSGGGTCNASGSGAMSSPASLPAGGSVTYTAICPVNLSATGTIVNTATVAVGATVIEINSSNNQDTDSDTVGPAPLFANGFESGNTSAWSITTP